MSSRKATVSRVLFWPQYRGNSEIFQDDEAMRQRGMKRRELEVKAARLGERKPPNTGSLPVLSYKDGVVQGMSWSRRPWALCRLTETRIPNQKDRERNRFSASSIQVDQDVCWNKDRTYLTEEIRQSPDACRVDLLPCGREGEKRKKYPTREETFVLVGPST